MVVACEARRLKTFYLNCQSSYVSAADDELIDTEK